MAPFCVSDFPDNITPGFDLVGYSVGGASESEALVIVDAQEGGVVVILDCNAVDIGLSGVVSIVGREQRVEHLSELRDINHCYQEK